MQQNQKENLRKVFGRVTSGRYCYARGYGFGLGTVLNISNKNQNGGGFTNQMQNQKRILEKNNLENAYIRPLVYLGANMSLEPTDKVHVMLCAWEWGRYLGDSQLKLMTSSFQRPNPKATHIDAKITGHYTNSILATTEAKSNGFDEGLLLDMNGYVAEGPGANFFYEKEDKLYTAPLGNILAGITRQTIFEIAKDLGIEVIEKYFTPEDVYQADGAFFTGTAAEVAGIESLDNNEFNFKWEDTLGKTLSDAYLFRVQKREFKNYMLI